MTDSPADRDRPGPGRVRLRGGGATDVGQVRSVNQDSILIGADRYVVADGMGGHQAGEVASATAIETVASADLVSTAGGPRVLDLITAVQDANRAVFDRGTHNPNLAGMGTTLVGIAVVVEDGEERLAIVNVGDSRAYRLSGTTFDQITHDHSLVAELVREGRITAEEAEHHPQRNIVTRALGIDSVTDVDDFQLLPRAGDRYLLCSDGLTNEVEDGDIATVLRTVDDPDAAAAELIRRANEHGGRDNITVLIVDVVDDGGLAASASAAVPDAEDFRHDPGTDTQTFLAVPDIQADDHDRDRTTGRSATRSGRRRNPAQGIPVADPTPAPDAPRQRAVTVRSVAFVVLVLAVFAGAAYLVNDYARNSYYVSIDGDDVVIYRGRPGGVLWIDPTQVAVTEVPADDVPAASRDSLESGVVLPDLAAAESFVANLQAQIDEITPPVTPTTVDATTPTSALVTPVPLTMTPAPTSVPAAETPPPATDPAPAPGG